MKRILFVHLGLLCIFSAGSFGQKKNNDGFDTTYYTAKFIAKAINSETGPVLKKAFEIRDKYPGNFSIEQISETFNYFYKNWKYIPDPGYEYFEPAGSVVESLDGDCDDYAIGMVSVIDALGGVGRIIAVSGHAYPEVYIGKDLSDSSLQNIVDRLNGYYNKNFGYKNLIGNINYHIDRDGTYWLNLDYQMDYPGGMFIETSPNARHIIVYSDGTYRESFLNAEMADYLAKRKVASL